MSPFFISTKECSLDFNLFYELAHDYLHPNVSGLTADEQEFLLTVFGSPGEVCSAWKPDFLRACYLLIGQLQRIISEEQDVSLVISRAEIRKLLRSLANFVGFIRTLPNVIVWGTDQTAVKRLSQTDWSMLDELPHFRTMTLHANWSKKIPRQT